LIFDRV